MPNIKFSYYYRDSANYKKSSFVIFDDPGNVELSKLDTLIKSKLIDGVYFYADKWQLPELFFDDCDFRIEPTWHEFLAVEYSEASGEKPINLREFASIIEQTKLCF